MYRRSYYLIVALNEKGEMIFEEDREGTGGAFAARIKDRNFLNGARHSIYYRRTNTSSILMVNYSCELFYGYDFIPTIYFLIG